MLQYTNAPMWWKRSVASVLLARYCTSAAATTKTSSSLILALFGPLQVVPVIEKDIYRPHEIEHVKHEVHVYHERPQIVGTAVAKPISILEYEKASGVKLHDFQSTDNPNRDTLTTDEHIHDSQGHNRSGTGSR